MTCTPSALANALAPPMFLYPEQVAQQVCFYNAPVNSQCAAAWCSLLFINPFQVKRFDDNNPCGQLGLSTILTAYMVKSEMPQSKQ